MRPNRRSAVAAFALSVIVGPYLAEAAAGSAMDRVERWVRLFDLRDKIRDVKARVHEHGLSVAGQISRRGNVPQSGPVAIGAAASAARFNSVVMELREISTAVFGQDQTPGTPTGAEAKKVDDEVSVSSPSHVAEFRRHRHTMEAVKDHADEILKKIEAEHTDFGMWLGADPGKWALVLR